MPVALPRPTAPSMPPPPHANPHSAHAPKLPWDVLRHVVEHLDDDTFLASETVSKAWRGLCHVQAVRKERAVSLAVAPGPGSCEAPAFATLKKSQAARTAYRAGSLRAQPLVPWGSAHAAHFVCGRAFLLGAHPLIFRGRNHVRLADVLDCASLTITPCLTPRQLAHPVFAANGRWAAFRDHHRDADEQGYKVTVFAAARGANGILSLTVEVPLQLSGTTASHFSAPYQEPQFSADSTRLAIHRRDGIHIFRTGPTFTRLALCSTSHQRWNEAFTFSPDGRWLLGCETPPGAAQERRLIVFDAHTGDRRAERPGHLPLPGAASFSGGGRYLALTNSHALQLFDWAQNFSQPLVSLPLPQSGHNQWWPKVAFAPTCDVLALLTHHTFDVWVHKLELLHLGRGPRPTLKRSCARQGRHPARSLQWSPLGTSLLVSAGPHAPPDIGVPIGTCYRFEPIELGHQPLGEPSAAAVPPLQPATSPTEHSAPNPRHAMPPSWPWDGRRDR